MDESRTESIGRLIRVFVSSLHVLEGVEGGLKKGSVTVVSSEEAVRVVPDDASVEINRLPDHRFPHPFPIVDDTLSLGPHHSSTNGNMHHFISHTRRLTGERIVRFRLHREQQA